MYIAWDEEDDDDEDDGKKEALTLRVDDAFDKLCMKIPLTIPYCACLAVKQQDTK